MLKPQNETNSDYRPNIDPDNSLQKILSRKIQIKSDPREENKYYSQATKISSPHNKEDFFYYEAENYKNYKYKLYNIALSEIERKKLTGKKIHVSDYNYPLDMMEEKAKQRFFGLKRNEMKEKIENENKKLTQFQSFHENNKLNILNKINKLSMDLKIENIKKPTGKSKENEIIENYKSNESLQSQSLLPRLEKSKEFKKQDAEQLLNGRLMGIINKKKLDLPILNTTSKNTNNSINKEEEKMLYRKKIGGGFTLIVKKNELRKKGKNKSMIIDQSLLQEINNKSMTLNEQINQIIKSRKIKKNKNSSDFKFRHKKNRTIYEEFIYLAKCKQKILKNEEKEKFISFPIFTDNFNVFKNNSEETCKRILIAFDINPFEENLKIFWEPFSKFMKILINRESSILDRVNFLCKFFTPNEKIKTMKIEEFLGILKSLAIKLGENNNFCVNLFNLYIQILQYLDILNEKSNQIVLDDFRQALINNDLNINDLLDLITSAFE